MYSIFKDSFSLSYSHPNYELIYEEETKKYTLSFLKLFLFSCLFLCIGFFIRDLIIARYLNTAYPIIGATSSLILILNIAKFMKLKKIYVDFFFCTIISTLFLVHFKVILPKILKLDITHNVLFFTGMGLSSLNIFLYVAKVKWYLLLAFGCLSYSVVIFEFLKDPAVMNGLWISLVLQILFCYLILFFLFYIKEKTERKNFYERKKAEDQLKIYQELLRDILPNQIIILDSMNPKIIFKNKITLDLFETDNDDEILEEILKFKVRNITDNIDEIHYFKEIYDYYLQHDELTGFINLEAVYPKKTHNDTDHQVFSPPMADYEKNHYFTIKLGRIQWGLNSAFLFILNDTSSIVNYKKLKEIDEYKDILLATVSHDLRTPLSGITGMLEIILEKITDKKIKKQINLAIKSGKILSYMINDILDFSQFTNKKLKLNPQIVNVKNLLEEVIAIIKVQIKQKKIEFRANISNELNETKVFVDPIRIKQILFNLLTNAIKFTKKGYVSLEMEKIEHETRKNLRIKVADTGIGISSDFFDKIFTLFGKLKQNDPHINKNGIGLGLVISNNLAQMMSRDGKGISLKSKVDFGSEFSFTVPIEEELINFDNSLDEDKKLINVNSYNMNSFLKCSFLKNKWEKNNEKTNDLRILIVDDDSMNCLIHSKYLESFNIYYDIASNGSEAIEFIICKKSNHIYYSLIIMDCNMPIMNGFEAAENIKGMINDKNIPYVPIIAVTANASIQEIEHCKKAGMEFFIPKPVSKAALKEKIEETLKIKLE